LAYSRYLHSSDVCSWTSSYGYSSLPEYSRLSIGTTFPISSCSCSWSFPLLFSLFFHKLTPDQFRFGLSTSTLCSSCSKNGMSIRCGLCLSSSSCWWFITMAHCWFLHLWYNRLYLGSTCLSPESSYMQSASSALASTSRPLTFKMSFQHAQICHQYPAHTTQYWPWSMSYLL